MSRLVDKTIAAVCAEIGREEGAGGPPYDDVAAFVSVQIRNAPSFLRGALLGATAFFGLCGLRGGAFFHRLDPGLRRRQMDRWRRSRRGPFRDLMKFYDSLCLMALYSRGGGASPGDRDDRT